MTTEREQLELAARVMGIEVTWNDAYQSYTRSVEGQEEFEFWNPLHNPGDCFEMERKLRIDVAWYRTRVICCDINGEVWKKSDFEDYPTRQDARMAASVAVAAAIGRMK